MFLRKYSSSNVVDLNEKRNSNLRIITACCTFRKDKQPKLKFVRLERSTKNQLHFVTFDEQRLCRHKRKVTEDQSIKRVQIDKRDFFCKIKTKSSHSSILTNNSKCK